MSNSITQEMEFTILHGIWYDATPNFRKRVVQNMTDNTLRGKYLAVKLDGAFLNIELKSKYEFEKNVRRYTLLEVTLHNVWEYRISYVKAVLVDSEGYQHLETDNGLTVPIQKDLLPSGRDLFSHPSNEIEADCKTRGWLWFDALDEGLFPHRAIFKVDIFSRGQTSGSVKDTETLEFAIAEYTIRSV